MRTLILCGGKGTRAYPHTLELPKPLLEVGGRPVLGHVMEIYAQQGFTDFVLAAGFKVEQIEEFVKTLPSEWSVEVRDTGVDTNTGGRVMQCAPDMGSTYFLTYADGLGNVDLQALLDFHQATAGSAAVTVVPLPSQYGTIDSDSTHKVVKFTEKPRLPDYWINAGFFVMDQGASQWFAGQDLERDILPALGLAGELYSYKHSGFWKSMDTHKDSLELTALYEASAESPWTFTPLSDNSDTSDTSDTSAKSDKETV
ncbi:MAG TPA: sugar phosphate nucleotidyltransferase [Acidimicrobiales bacterium]|nr:sugar phosphate nucleotidyltransferase [Acidimicrobiales bacterium]